MLHHKNIRLRRFNDVGQRCYFLTLCCFDRPPVFSDLKRRAWLSDEFRAESASRSFAIHAYCIMPDHFHFVAEGQGPSSDLLGFAKSFKIKTSHQYQAEASHPLWQKEILRSHQPFP